MGKLALCSTLNSFTCGTHRQRRVRISFRQTHMSKRPILKPAPGKNRALGLFAYKRSDTTTPLQDAGAIVIGVVCAVLGIALIMAQMQARAGEIKSWGISETHWGGFLLGAGFLLTAFWFAHAGVIYWFRRLFKRHSPDEHSHRLIKSP